MRPLLRVSQLIELCIANCLFLLGLLKLQDKRFNSEPPFDKVVNGRKLLAKFIGLALYKAGRECVMSRGPDCSIEGPCCLRHRAEGIREAHDMFNDLLKAVEDKISENPAFNTTIQAIQIELKVRVVFDHLSYAASLESNISDFLENLILKYFTGSSYVSEKLNGRAAVLRDIVQNNTATSLPAILESKYPFSLFEGNLRNFLKSIDALFPEVLLGGFVSRLMEDKNKLSRSASDILSLSRSASKLASPAKPVHLHLPTKQIFSSDLVIEKSSPHSPIRILSPQPHPVAMKRPHSVLSPVRKPTVPIVAPEVADDRNPFAGVKIQGKFFRGVIEPSDERFAAIADGNDAQVKHFILERARKAAANFVRTIPKPATKPVTKVPTTVTSNVATANVSISTSQQAALATLKTNSSMLDRQASAQKIAWESQQQSPSPASPRNFSQDSRQSQQRNFEQIQLVSGFDSDGLQRIRLPSRARRRFSDEEIANLIAGYKRFGADWRSILNHYQFDNRTNVDLKDKARNLMKHNLL